MKVSELYTNENEVSTTTTIIHNIANMHRTMTPEEYGALVLSISEVGQLQPVIMYRGKLVDGRHRMKAMKDLGIDRMKAKHLNAKLTLNEVKDVVLGTEVKRNNSIAQRAIQAWFWLKEQDSKVAQGIAAEKFGVEQAQISRAKKLEEYIGSKRLADFERNGKIRIGDKTTGTLQIAIALAKKLEQQQNENLRLSNNEPDEATKRVYNIIDSFHASGDMVQLGKIITKAKLAMQDLTRLDA